MIKMSVPSILSMMIQAAYNVVDSIWVAKISNNALAALSLAFPIQMILIAVAVGTGVGASSLISRLLGQGRDKEASNAAEHVLIMSVVYGIVMAIGGLLLSKNLIGLFTEDKELIELGSSYIRIILLGSTAMFIPMIANNVLRGEGNTFIPMISMLIGSLINIVLDPFFIFGYGFFPELGIEGAAVATVVSRLLSGVFIVFILFVGKHQINLNFKKFKFDLSIIKGIYAVGLPAMTIQLLASLMMSGLNKILAESGAIAISTMGIYFRLQSFVFMPVFGLNQGYMPIIGYNYGHNNPNRMKETIKLGFIVAFVFTTLGCLLFQIFPKPLIKLFSSDEELLRIAIHALRTISIAFPIIGPAIIGSTTFQAIGKGVPSLVLSFSRQIILLLPLAYILYNTWGLDIIWYSFPISEGISAILMAVWLSKSLKNEFRVMEMNRS
nr:MATE family efflux transporter [Sporosalibacterium faouarense]